MKSNPIMAATAALALAATAAAQEVEWRLIRPSNTGVPGEEVQSAKWGPEGNLWVAARWPFWREGGVAVYDLDSQLWTTWSNADSPMPSEWINDLEFAPDGSLWLAAGWLDSNGGLVRKDGDDWTIYTTANAPLKHNVVRSIDLDPEGHVWLVNSGVQATDHALFEFDGQHWRMFEVGGDLPWDLPWKALSSVVVASDGHVFVANETLSGLAEHDGAGWVLHGANVTRFSRLTEDLDGNIWMSAGVGGGNSFYKFDRSTGAFTAYNASNTPLSDTTPTAIGVEREGRVYLANWFGQVVRTSDGGQTWELFTDQNTRLHSIAPHPDGDVWVTSPGAARHLDPSGVWLEAFNSYNTGMPDYFVDDLHRGRASGRMLVASAEAGVSLFDGERWVNRGSHNPNADWPALADGSDGAFEDSRGNVWIGTNGVIRWNPQTGQLDLWDWRNTAIFGVTAFKYFGETPGGEIWAATRYNSIYRFDGQEWARLELDGDVDRGIERDSAGNMWVAGRGAVHRWDGAGWTTWDWGEYPILFDQGGIQAFAVGPDDSVWLGMGDGLIRFDGQTFTLYDESNSPMPAKSVQGIAFRGDGLMAFSVHTFQAQTPFPSGVVVIDGDIDVPADWTIYSYGNDPIPHYQLGPVEFDGDGHLWITAVSEGVAVALLGGECDADFNGDGVVNSQDFIDFLNDFVAGDPSADYNGDGTVNSQDFITYLNDFVAGC